eukprot:4635601-Prymnesium_polylepis.1
MLGSKAVPKPNSRRPALARPAQTKRWASCPPQTLGVPPSPNSGRPARASLPSGHHSPPGIIALWAP